uniref:Uncharacterized protein n=1 Tax=Arundo donax TaxID=35708 RepID=A0A0A9GCD3_ARUDO
MTAISLNNSQLKYLVFTPGPFIFVERESLPCFEQKSLDSMD